MQSLWPSLFGGARRRAAVCHAGWNRAAHLKVSGKQMGRGGGEKKEPRVL